jgi:uncharacterized protein
LGFSVFEAAMRISLEELAFHPIVVAETYSSGALDFKGYDFRPAEPVKVNAVAELVGAEIHVRGHVATRLLACCDRCLASVSLPVDQDFDLFYRPMSTIAQEEEVELPEDELDVGFFSGDGIEMADVVTEQVILSMPMKVVCREDCLGLCPTCKANLNLGACGCTPKQGVSPFSSLKQD